MYTDFAGIEHRNSEVTESMIQHDVEGYVRLVTRFIEMNEPDSAEMYAICAVRSARHLAKVRKNHASKNAVVDQELLPMSDDDDAEITFEQLGK